MKAAWVAAVLAALVIMVRGLWATVYFEPTAEAIAEERRGQLLVLVAGAVLVAAGAFALVVLRTSVWAAAAVAAPAVICGLATLTAAPAILSVLIAYPITVAGVVGVLASPGVPE